MATKTDKQVQELFEIVQQKKSAIVKAEKPNWQTNCSFGYDKNSSSRMNIQVVNDIDELTEILAFLLRKERSHYEASEILGVESQFKWLGFNFEQWKSDIQTRIDKIQISKKKQELEQLESRLGLLISPELRAEMELAEITKILNK